MLTEKEIEKIIFKHVHASMIPVDEDFDPEKDYFPFSISIIGAYKASTEIAKQIRGEVLALASEWESEVAKIRGRSASTHSLNIYSYMRGQACGLKRAARELRERFGLDKGAGLNEN